MITNIMSIYFLGMMIAVVYCTAHVRSLNGSGYARIIVLLSFAVCFYIGGYTMELNSSGIPQIFFWNKVEYLGIPFVSALWLTVGLMYTGHFFRYKKILLAAIYLVPFVTLLLRFTNEYHHLYFASVGFIDECGRLLLVKKPGPWQYVQMIHSMAMVFITLGLFIRDFIKNGGRKAGKISLMISASFFAVAGLLLSFIKPFGLTIDYMALCLPITCVLVILAIMHYDFLETKSMARSKVFEASRDAILLVNRQNKIIDYNKSAKQLSEKIGMHLSDGYIAALFQHTPDLLQSLSLAETSVIKLHLDAEDRYYEVSTKGIDNKSTTYGWIKTIRDVTEIYKLNETLKKQAMMDELSGLSNRRAFMQTGKKIMAESGENGVSLHLFMMDLDNFKRVNDQYGHQTGDRVIQNLGKILKASFSAGSLIARLGGEEFAVLLAGFQDAEIRRKANGVLKSIGLYDHEYQGRKFHVTVSIGVAKKTDSSQSLETLLHKADQALYKSKDHGRNCVTLV